MHPVSDALSDKDGEASQEIPLEPDGTSSRPVLSAPTYLSNLLSGASFSTRRPPSHRLTVARLQPLLLRPDDGSSHSGRHRRDRCLGRRIR